MLNCTTPGRVAKIEWSRPMPTPSPGRKRVPRWRTMISPPFTLLAGEDLDAEASSGWSRGRCGWIRVPSYEPSLPSSFFAAGFDAAPVFFVAPDEAAGFRDSIFTSVISRRVSSERCPARLR